MDFNKQYLYKKFFKQRILEYNGQAFEDFFVQVMEKHNPNFQPVKAFGCIGDKKNDGFDKTTGTYYQVFAPENLNKKDTIYRCVKKLEKDFSKLFAYWNNLYPVKHFYYVVNDRYNGLPANVHDTISKLSKDPKYQGVTIDTLIAKDLENIFSNLNEKDMIDIVGFIPIVDTSAINFDILHDVINHILSLDITINIMEDLEVPDFYEKIKFNGLKNTILDLLKEASYQEDNLLKYFQNNRGLSDKLQKIFKGLYEESIKEIPDTEDNYPNKRFVYILNKCFTQKTSNVQHAILVLMAHYFSSCDIFEKPISSDDNLE